MDGGGGVSGRSKAGLPLDYCVPHIFLRLTRRKVVKSSIGSAVEDTSLEAGVCTVKRDGRRHDAVTAVFRYEFAEVSWRSADKVSV